MKSLGTKKIIVYRKQLLRISETFIKAQIKGYKKYSAILVGENFWHDSLPLNDVDHEVLSPTHQSSYSKTISKIRQRLGIPAENYIQQLSNLKPLLIHAHTGFDGVIAWPYAKRLNVPLIVTLHGQCTTTHKKDFFKGKLGFWNRFYPFQLLRLSKQKNVFFIAVSEATKKTAIEFGLPAEKIRVLYSGILLDEFPKSSISMRNRPKRIVFVARLLEFKGCKYLIEAFKRVQRKILDAELIIIGDGPLRNELELQAGKDNLSIVFKGAKGRQDVLEALSNARLFCLPSITTEAGNYETFGVVAIEAQAVGVPVVTSARGAKESVIDGVTGFYFEERNIEQLETLIEKLLTDHELAEKIGNQAAEHVRSSFSTENCNILIEQYYDEILKKN